MHMRTALAFLGVVLLVSALESETDPLLNPTDDELELMSQEMKKREISQMVQDAENLKIELNNPQTSAQRKVEAAAEFKKIYEATKFELYKTSFKESIRMIGVSMDKLAAKSCSEFGVHFDSQEDKYIRENCKKAIKMIWGMLLVDKLKNPKGLYALLKNNVRDYLSNRINVTLPSLSST